MDSTRRRPGRPRRTNEAEIRRDILLALSLGTPLTVACRRHALSVDTIALWASGDPAFAEDVAGARALGWDSLAHECLEIADDGRNDWMAIHDREGEIVGWRVNGEAVQRSRLRIETRMRLLGKWAPETYGEAERKVKVEAAVTTTTRHVVDPRLLDDAQRAALRAVLEAAAAQGLVDLTDDDDDSLAGRDSSPGPIGDDRGGDLAAVLADSVGPTRPAGGFLAPPVTDDDDDTR